MSTRGLYVVKDNENSFTIYKHWDNYPSGALDFIKKAKAYAWDLPRFDASDFGAAFIAANKTEGGNVYLTNESTTNADVMGIEFVYTIEQDQQNKSKLKVTIEHLGTNEPALVERV